MPELTVGQATDQVERHLSDAIAALPDRPSLRPLRHSARPCPDPVTGEDGDTVMVSRGYWLEGLDQQPGVYLDALRTHWSSHGFRVEADTHPVPRFVTVEHQTDGYGMSVVVSDTGMLSISASSPCAVPDDDVAL